MIDQVHLGQPRRGEPVEFIAAHRPRPFGGVGFILAAGPAAFPFLRVIYQRSSQAGPPIRHAVDASEGGSR